MSKKIPRNHLMSDDEVYLKELPQTMKIIEPPPLYKPPVTSLLTYTKPTKPTAGSPVNKHSAYGINAFIIGGGYAESRMFNSRTGWNATASKNLADIFVFTGGEDINPALYNEEPHTTVHFNQDRDNFEVGWYNELDRDILKFGICRGAQLLNVLNGGSLFQHVDGHHGSHKIMDWKGNQTIMSNSIHHQMMIPGPGAVLLATADVSTFRINAGGEYLRERGEIPKNSDAEVIWYPKTNSLCVQGHPEYESATADFKNYVFDLLETYYWELWGDLSFRKSTGETVKPLLSSNR